MAITWKMLVEPDFLATTATTMYTVPTGQTVQVDQATAFNSDGSARTITVYMVPSGGSASDENAIIKALSLDAGETKILPELYHKLPAGMMIQALASASGVVSLAISGSVSS